MAISTVMHDRHKALGIVSRYASNCDVFDKSEDSKVHLVQEACVLAVDLGVVIGIECCEAVC